MLKTFRFRRNPTWCILRRSLKTIWGNFKLRPVIPTFIKNEMTECSRKQRQPTSIGITWHIQPFSMQSARSFSYQFFFHSCVSSRFYSQGTVNCLRITPFFESDHATMSDRLCYKIAEGFRFMPLSLVRLRTFRLSTWVGWV